MAKDFVQVTVGDYTVLCCSDGQPDDYGLYRAHATLVEHEDVEGPDAYQWCVGVRVHQEARLLLLVAQGCTLRWEGEIVNPGILLVLETGCLFLGMQTRLVAYDLRAIRRLWVERTEGDFWGWSRHGDVVLMAAELYR